MNFNSADLKAHKMKVYCSNNLLLSVAGNFRASKVEYLIESFCSSFPQGKQPVKAKIDPQGLEIPLGPFDANILHYPGMRNINLAVGWRACVSGRRGRNAWRILNTLLGVGYSSLLYRRLREERGLTYLVTTKLRFYDDQGTFRIFMDLRDIDLAEAIEVIFDSIREISEGNFEDEDLDRAREIFWGNLILKLEDTMEWSRWLNHAMAIGERADNLSILEEEIRRIRKKDLVDIARKQLSREGARISLAGDTSVIVRFLPAGIEGKMPTERIKN